MYFNKHGLYNYSQYAYTFSGTPYSWIAQFPKVSTVQPQRTVSTDQATPPLPVLQNKKQTEEKRKLSGQIIGRVMFRSNYRERLIRKGPCRWKRGKEGEELWSNWLGGVLKKPVRAIPWASSGSRLCLLYPQPLAHRAFKIGTITEGGCTWFSVPISQTDWSQNTCFSAMVEKRYSMSQS